MFHRTTLFRLKSARWCCHFYPCGGFCKHHLARLNGHMLTHRCAIIIEHSHAVHNIPLYAERLLNDGCFSSLFWHTFLLFCCISFFVFHLPSPVPHLTSCIFRLLSSSVFCLPSFVHLLSTFIFRIPSSAFCCAIFRLFVPHLPSFVSCVPSSVFHLSSTISSAGFHLPSFVFYHPSSSVLCFLLVSVFFFVSRSLMDFFLGHSGTGQAYFDEFLDGAHLITVPACFTDFSTYFGVFSMVPHPSSYDPPSLVHKSTYPRLLLLYRWTKVFFVQSTGKE